MSIEAFCPNGHRILCPDDSLGRAARCPKCATPFRIGAPPTATPAANPEAPAVSPRSPMPEPTPKSRPACPQQRNQVPARPLKPRPPVPRAASWAAGATSPAVRVNSARTAPPRPTLLCAGVDCFSLPQRPQAQWPREARGRLGQCPHCNTKFQIPPLEVIRAAQSGQLENLEEVQFPDSEGGSSIATSGITEIEDVAHAQQDPSELEQMLASSMSISHPPQRVHRAASISLGARSTRSRPNSPAGWVRRWQYDLSGHPEPTNLRVPTTGRD